MSESLSSPASNSVPSLDSEGVSMPSESSCEIQESSNEVYPTLPEEYFLLKKQNRGFQVPFFISSLEEVKKVHPPDVVKTWEERYKDLNNDQQCAFDQFEKEAQSKSWYDSEKYDNWYLIRYLTARNFDCRKAMQQLEDTVEWLKIPENNATTCSICQENPDLHCSYFAGWDLEYRPVLYMSMRWGPERKHPLQHMIAAFHHLIKLMPVGVEKWVCITDFETYSHLRDSNPSMGISVIQTIQRHFPERLGKMICVNPPKLFWGLWKLFSPFVDPPTKEKAEFLYTEAKPSIYDRFPKIFPETLCQYLYDSLDRSKYNIPADPLIWRPCSLGYPSNYEERKEDLKDLKKRLKLIAKEAKAQSKQEKKNKKEIGLS